MSPRPGRGPIDGGWWPQSRDLAVELADLVDHFPTASGRVVRALFSPPDWEVPARRIPVAGGYVKVGSFPRDDTHIIQLKTSDRKVLYVLVVPPDTPPERGEEAVLAAATPGYVYEAPPLETLTESPESDATGHWSDDGGSWSAPNDWPSSSRAGD
nr:DUF5994 family protein [Nocardioides luteus]